jgi:deoxyribose-phosphate aldolase
MNRYEEALRKFDFNLQEKGINQKTTEIIGEWEENNNPEVLKLVYSCIDLTSLGSDDSRESVWKWVEKVNKFDDSHPDMDNVAAICVYPNFVQTVKDTLTADVKIASVAGGFPSSQTFIEVKIAETSLAVADGADEIDIVFNCGHFFDDNYEELCEEIAEIKEACKAASLKVILETSLLKTAANIKKAAILSMYSGADFIKTSTGKVYPGASPEAVLVMCEAIKEYYQLYHRKIGIKVAGGVRTVKDAVSYYTIVKKILGKEWLTPQYFRIGTSGLAENLLNELEN